MRITGSRSSICQAPYICALRLTQQAAVLGARARRRLIRPLAQAQVSPSASHRASCRAGANQGLWMMKGLDETSHRPS